MKLVQSRTRWKNRIHAWLMKHGLEVGSIDRVPGPGHLARYAGVVLGVNASGGDRHDTGLRTQANKRWKHGFMEAANAVIRQQKAYSES